MKLRLPAATTFLSLGLFVPAVTSFGADSLIFSTGTPDGRIATASRPDAGGASEIESADDFILSHNASVTSGTFTGLIPSNASLSSIQGVTVEIYRVFPNDSGIPSVGRVPTRVNSPSDVAFASRDSGSSSLSFSPSVLNPSFAAANSVLNGINLLPNQHTGGEGPVMGQEVQFNVTFTTPLDLPADHYFFVPQVQLSDGNFFWLSATRPIVAPGTPQDPDLQSWIRNEKLDPDWLRIGTDIVGGDPVPTFNAAFSLNGTTSAPDGGSTLGMLCCGVLALARVGVASSRKTR